MATWCFARFSQWKGHCTGMTLLRKKRTQMQLNGSVVGKNGKKIVLFFVYDNLVVVHFYK